MSNVSSFLQLRVRPLLESHWLLAAFLGLVLLILILYAPVFGMGFVSDDFIEVGVRHNDARDTLAYDDIGGWLNTFVERSLIDPVSGVEMFRPTRQAIYAADYIMWHLDAPGYHVTNLVLLLISSFVVLLLAYQLTRRKNVALVAALLFALHPAHTAPTAEISSRGHVLAGLFVGLTVLFYALTRTRRNYIVALVCCALAIGSKETALATPLLVALYELIYHRDEILRTPLRVAARLAPFFVITAAAIGFRLLWFGSLSNSRYGVGSWELSYQIQGYSMFTLEPFIYDISNVQTILFLSVLVALILLYRKRREVAFGILWAPIALIFTITAPPQERYFFTPSIGLAIAFASVLSQPFTTETRWTRWVGPVATGALCVSLLLGSVSRVADYRNAGDIVQTIVAQIKTLHPTMPQNARLSFVGLPEAVRRGYVFNNVLGVQYLMQWVYDDRTLEVTSGEAFPIALDAPDRTFFFEYERRKLTERADLVQALRERRRCGDAPDSAIVWNFSADAQGWEPWSEIEGWQNQDGALGFNTTGDDPFMGSPFIEVSPRDVKRIDVQMRVDADQPTVTGELYWQTANMDDFSRDAHTPFTVKADGKSRTYKVFLDVRGDEPILRLRLDPTDAPAEIQLETIAIRCK